MSYTVIPGPHDAERTMTNEVNRAARRCRIGKIRWKQDLRGLVYPHIPGKPLDLFRYPKRSDLSDPCADCLGKACGNVACPKRMVVKC